MTEVAEAAYPLGYPKHGPAIASETLIAKLIMELGQMVPSKYLDFHTWEALPDVAIVYVDYDQEMEIGRHILWHHVRASGKQNALSYVICAAHWIKPGQGITTDLTRIFHRSRATNEYGIALVCPKIQVSNLDQRAGNAEAKLYRRN